MLRSRAACPKPIVNPNFHSSRLNSRATYRYTETGVSFFLRVVFGSIRSSFLSVFGAYHTSRCPVPGETTRLLFSCIVSIIPYRWFAPPERNACVLRYVICEIKQDDSPDQEHGFYPESSCCKRSTKNLTTLGY